jgi:lysine-ketoglutarate reductase/saccharopine dehydrogenase-like protein (TIGR00300 family)
MTTITHSTATASLVADHTAGDPTALGEHPASHLVEQVELSGHIIDSLLLPKVLDEVMKLGGTFRIESLEVGRRRSDPSTARLLVEAGSRERLDEILVQIARHGAVPVHQQDCDYQVADLEGVFPEGFYCTTNEDTEIRVNGQWLPVGRQKMDAAIRLDPTTGAAQCVVLNEVRRGDFIVVGHYGVRVHPHQRSVARTDAFSFMNSSVSSEKPKGVAVREVAASLKRTRAEGGKVLVVAGPAVVHTGCVDLFCELIRGGYVQRLFAGNALATHDIEQALYGTSLGVSVTEGLPLEGGHQHHLRSINRIRRLGGIAKAVDKGVLTSGVMYECVRGGVPYLLAGSIRDDGPLPDVITDSVAAQAAMRDAVQDVSFCLMIATTLHSIAVGNLLPARVKVVCVDINPATVTKLMDRGSFQTVGIVTDIEPFMRSLVKELGLNG